METTKVSIDGWINKENVNIGTVKYYSALKKERNPAICNNMNEPGGYYAKWNESDT